MPEVAPASPLQRQVALTLLLQNHSVETRAAAVNAVLSAATRNELSLEGLLLARQSGQPVGSVLFIPQPDGTAFVWPPGVEESTDSEAIADALLRRLTETLQSRQIRMGQCLLESGADDASHRLQRNGFILVAELDYLRRPLTSPLAEVSRPSWVATSFQPGANDERFIAVLEQTYQDTLDCPTLNPIRTGADALQTHRLVGRFDPERWQVFSADGQDVAVLLLAEQADERSLEIVYLGVIPTARGRGFGRLLVAEAMRTAELLGSRSIQLAVDSGNGPARQIYEQAGFGVEAQRRVLIWSREQLLPPG